MKKTKQIGKRQQKKTTQSTPPLSPSPLHRRLTASKTNTSTALAARTEHGCVSTTSAIALEH